MTERQRYAVEAYLGSAEFRATIRQLIALRLLYGTGYRDAAERVISTLGAGLRMYLRDQRTPTQTSIAELLLGFLANTVDKYVESSRKIWQSIDDPEFRRFLDRQEATIPQTIDAVSKGGPAKDLVAWIERYTTAAADRYARIRAPHWDTQVVVPIQRVYIPAKLEFPRFLDPEGIKADDVEAFLARHRAEHQRRIESQLGHIEPIHRGAAVTRAMRDLWGSRRGFAC